MRILITGGAGFVGSHLALRFRQQYPTSEVVALDNLRRRGSELNLPRLGRAGVSFVHGDVRSPTDLADLPGTFDAVIEASAEPSVHAGLDGAPDYVLQTNLLGAIHCLEFARRRAGSLVFLSTSRVYSIGPLQSLALQESETRFELAPRQELPGVTGEGISEAFATHLPRSLYGASKLAAELLLQEYVEAYNLRAVINRCGVIAGPGQFGRVDQGVFTLWVAHHYFSKPLRYTGFGGRGKQVRDLLHPDDLFALLARQLEGIGACSGEIFNVGGGRAISTSLVELTQHCREVTGREVPVDSDAATSPVDVPLYLSDAAKARRQLDWAPRLSVTEIVADIYRWLREEEKQLRPLFT